jgi:hypothetical protein
MGSIALLAAISIVSKDTKTVEQISLPITIVVAISRMV